MSPPPDGTSGPGEAPDAEGRGGSQRRPGGPASVKLLNRPPLARGTQPMVEFKVVISEAAKSYARPVGDPQSAGFLGKRIGETIGGELIGLPGYTLTISGGTDKSGFVLRQEIPGSRLVRIFVGEGLGFHAPRKGQRKRRTFRGSAISEDTVQINLVVEQKGSKPLSELLSAS